MDHIDLFFGCITLYLVKAVHQPACFFDCCAHLLTASLEFSFYREWQMWTPFCMRLQCDDDDNDQVGLDALLLVSVFPPSAHILFIFNFGINIPFLMLCCINCFYNGGTVKPFEPCMLV